MIVSQVDEEMVQPEACTNVGFSSGSNAVLHSVPAQVAQIVPRAAVVRAVVCNV